ncbi:MAG: DNA polymerase III subunit delta, partial [Burkholderiales bacterium]
PPLLLWALAEEIRTIARIKTALQAGEPLAQAMRDTRVWGARQENMPKALRRLELPQLYLALQRAADADRMIKGLDDGDVWDTMREMGLVLMSPPGRVGARTIGGKIRSTI